MASVETRLSSQLSKREQEMIALQARMQASYQDHVAQTQGLNAKVSSFTQILQFRLLLLSLCISLFEKWFKTAVQSATVNVAVFFFFTSYLLIF